MSSTLDSSRSQRLGPSLFGPRANEDRSQSPTTALAPSSAPLEPTSSNESSHQPDRLRWLFDSTSNSTARDASSSGPSGTTSSAPGPVKPTATASPWARRSSEASDHAPDRMHSRSSTNLTSPPLSIFQSPARFNQPLSHAHAHSASLTRTHSGNSTASTAASSDFLPTPKTPAVTDRWGRTAEAVNSGSGHKKGKGVVMVDPRFAFPKRTSGRKSTGPIITRVGEGEGGVGGDQMAREGSFIASLGLAPLVDRQGNQIPLYPTRRPSSALSDLQQVGPPSPTVLNTGGLLSAFDPLPRANSPPLNHQNKQRTLFKSQSKRRRRKSGSFAGSPRANSSPDLRGLAGSHSPPRESRRRSVSPRGSPHASKASSPPGHRRVVTISTPTRHRRRSSELKGPVFHRDAGAAPTSICEALTFPKPRITALSPPASPKDERRSFPGKGRSVSSPNVGGKGKARQIEPDDEMEEIASLRGGYASSVRRVLAENEASRREREDWSDSSTGGPLAAWADRRRTKSSKQRQSRDENIALGPHGSTRQKKASHRSQERQTSAWSGDEDGPDIHLEYSPPVPHSFDPFTSIVRKLSTSRPHGRTPSSVGAGLQQRLGLGFVGLSGSRSATNLAAEARASSESRQPRSRQRSASDAGQVTGPRPSEDSSARCIGNRPIVHLGRSPSLDSLYQRNVNSAVPRLPSQYGEALLPAGPVGLPTSPRPVDRRQNAFVTLPPSLHHLLRAPDSTFVPSRPPPPVPFGPAFGTRLGDGAKRMSIADNAALVIALGSQLSQEANERDKRESERQLDADKRLAELARKEEQREADEGRPASQQPLEIKIDEAEPAAGDWRSRRAAALESNKKGGQPVIKRRASSLGLPGDKSQASTIRSNSLKSTSSVAPSTSTIQSPPPSQTEPGKMMIGPAPGFGPRTIAAHHKRGSSLSTITPLSPLALAINAARPDSTATTSTIQPIAVSASIHQRKQTDTPPLFPARSTQAWSTSEDKPFSDVVEGAPRPELLSADTHTSGSSGETALAASSPISARSGSSGEAVAGGFVDLGGDARPSFAGLFFRPPPSPRRPASGRSMLTSTEENRLSSGTFSSGETALQYTNHSLPSEPATIRLGSIGAHPFQMQRGLSTDSQQAEFTMGDFGDSTFGPRPISNSFVELNQATLDALFRQHGYSLEAEHENKDEQEVVSSHDERPSTAHSTAYETAEDGGESTRGPSRVETSDSDHSQSPVIVSNARFETLQPLQPTLSIYSSSSAGVPADEDEPPTPVVRQRPSLNPVTGPSTWTDTSFVSEYYSVQEGSPTRSFDSHSSAARTAPPSANRMGFTVVMDAPVVLSSSASGGSGSNQAESDRRSEVMSPTNSFLDYDDDDDVLDFSQNPSGRGSSRSEGRSSGSIILQPTSYSPLTPPPVVFTADESGESKPSPQTMPESPAFQSAFYDSEDGGFQPAESPMLGRHSYLSVDSSHFTFPGPAGGGGARTRQSGMSVNSAVSAHSGASSSGLDGMADHFPVPPREHQEESAEEERVEVEADDELDEDEDDGERTTGLVHSSSNLTAKMGRPKLAQGSSSQSLTNQILRLAIAQEDDAPQSEPRFTSGAVLPLPESFAPQPRSRYPPRGDSLSVSVPGAGHRTQGSTSSFLDFSSPKPASPKEELQAEHELGERSRTGTGSSEPRDKTKRWSEKSFATFFSEQPHHQQQGGAGRILFDDDDE